MEPVLEKFSKQLKSLRKSHHKKQEDIAKYLDCSVRQYQRLEYGEVNVQATTLTLLADYFGVSTILLYEALYFFFLKNQSLGETLGMYLSVILNFQLDYIWNELQS